MRTKSFPLNVCRQRNKPDAACREPPRCRVCGRVLAFAWQDRLCADCAADGKKGGRHV